MKLDYQSLYTLVYSDGGTFTVESRKTGKQHVFKVQLDAPRVWPHRIFVKERADDGRFRQMGILYKEPPRNDRPGFRYNGREVNPTEGSKVFAWLMQEAIFSDSLMNKIIVSKEVA